MTGLGDSLDLVPIGAWHGNGRKVQWWSPILLALWDESAGQFVGVCKCMSGWFISYDDSQFGLEVQNAKWLIPGFSDEFYKVSIKLCRSIFSR